MAYLDNIRTFLRVADLGSMSAAARDQRISPAVASSRIADLEKHLGVRLFTRTTRHLQITEQGRIFYDQAQRIVDAINDAEAAVADVTRNPRGIIHIAAPLGVGRRFIAPELPAFRARYPLVDCRLRLTDRNIDVVGEGLDAAFILGQPKDSALRIRTVAECPRVLCASPDYVTRRGMPQDGRDLVSDHHDCLVLRYAGATEPQWTLRVGRSVERFPVAGPLEADDGDVLTSWALDGHGIINKPFFEVADYLAAGSLVAVATRTPPVTAPLACIYPHKRYQDPKTRLFIDHMVDHCRTELSHIADRRAAAGD